MYGDAPHPADDPREAGKHDRRLYAVGPAAPDDDFDGTLDAIPVYPTEKLVGPLRDFVEWAVADGLPAAAAGAAGLSALATVTARAELALNSTFRVRPVVWVAPIGGTGTGKSGAMEQAFAEITQLYDDDRKRWVEEYELAKDGDAKGEAPARPEPITLGDVTLPAAARWLQSNGEAGCLVYDELTTLLASSTPADRAKLCEAWTARRPLHIQRVGDGGGKNAVDIYVSKPVLSIVGPLTPDNTRELGKEGDGFRARWLPHLIIGKAQLLDGGPHPRSWVQAITSLYPARQPRQWTLTGRARTAYEQARQRWLAEQDQPHPQSVIEALRKADAQCARIALIIAESCEADTAKTASARRNDISLDAVKAAIALTDYVMDCWKALPGARVLTLSMADEKLSDAAQELFSWLEERPKGTEGLPEGSEPRARATRREIQRARVGGAVTGLSLQAMLNAYDARWPGNTVGVEQGGNGGRTRTFYYFPKRASNGGSDGRNVVTVTTFPPGHSTDSTESAAGHSIAPNGNVVTDPMSQGACDNVPVTTFRAPGDIATGPDGWPADSHGSDANA